MKVETFLPVFPGFYGTLFEIEDDFEYINEQRANNGLPELEYDSVYFDYKAGEITTAKLACNFKEL